MRCPDCNKFVSFDTDTDPEEEGAEVSPEGHVSIEVRIVNTCAECGCELKEARLTLEGDVDVTHECPQAAGKEADLSVDADYSRTERTQTHDRHGRLLKGAMRYRKHYYGVEADVTVSCSCGATFPPIHLKDEVQASGMDELV